MAEILGRIRDRLILSLNDRPEIRETFGRFNMEAVETLYTTDGKLPKKAGELLISDL